MEGCFWQYNQHLPIRIQQEIQEREVKLVSNKQTLERLLVIYMYICINKLNK